MKIRVRTPGIPRSLRILALCGVISAVLFCAVISGPVSGGTEMEEECPTCIIVDWGNLGEWWEEREKTHTPPDQNERTEDKAAEMVYPIAELLIPADAELDGLVILDVRSPEEYAEGHIPGARNLYWGSVLPDGIDSMLDPHQAVLALKDAGVNSSDPILIWGNLKEASCVFCALDYLGHENLSILDGGIDAFENLVNEAPVVTKSDYTANLRPWTRVDHDRFGQWMNRSDLHVLDARNIFSDYGRSRLRGGIFFPAELVYDETGSLKDAGELDELFAVRGIHKDKVQLVYGTPDACTVRFALKLMGYNATVLEGGWWSGSEWVVSSIG